MGSHHILQLLTHGIHSRPALALTSIVLLDLLWEEPQDCFGGSVPIGINSHLLALPGFLQMGLKWRWWMNKHKGNLVTLMSHQAHVVIHSPRPLTQEAEFSGRLTVCQRHSSPTTRFTIRATQASVAKILLTLMGTFFPLDTCCSAMGRAIESR